MLINNTDISNFKATLLSKSIQTADVTIYGDWLRNALNPLYLGKQEKYKQIKLQFLIEGTTEEDGISCISNLIKQLEKCTLMFDDLSYLYDCTIVNKNNVRIVPGKFTLDVEFKSSYAYKAAVVETLNHVNSRTINIPGNLPTPAVVTVTAPVDTISLIVTGLGDSITINNLKANIPVVIDGEACTVLQNGLNKFADTDMWSFPTLQPGANTITLSSSNCVVSISYKPKWI